MRRVLAAFRSRQTVRGKRKGVCSERKAVTSYRTPKIDRVLARHYGFTDEELDFIINYDIKYRLGRDEE